MSMEHNDNTGTDRTTPESSTEVNSQQSQATVPEAFENPGVAPHRNRLGDDDPVAAKRSEWQVAIIFGISILATIGGVVGFYAFPVDEGVSRGGIRLSHLSLGLGLGIGMLGVGVGAIHWAKALMSDAERTEPREPMRSDEETRVTMGDMLRDGAKDANIARRPLLKGTLAGAVLLAPLTFLVPFIGGLGGDWNIDRFRRTAWAPRTNDNGQTEFVYLAHDPGGGRIRASDITEGSIVHVMPYELQDNYEQYLDEKAKAVTILVRVDPRELKEPEERSDWSYEGIVAYSKICTHVGCPVALYERQTHHLLCPCHQSTFDVTDQAKVVFGPATRPLPQLPIAVDDEGYLYAADDFPEPTGPSFWERDRV